MSKVTQDTSVDRFTDPNESFRFCSQLFDQIVRLINGGLGLVDNFDGKMHTLTFSSANTDTALVHGLGRVPSGYLVVRRSANMTVYDGANAWTPANAYLRASSAGSITVFVF